MRWRRGNGWLDHFDFRDFPRDSDDCSSNDSCVIKIVDPWAGIEDVIGGFSGMGR